MIQRVQSLLLFLASGLNIATLFVPVWFFNGACPATLTGLNIKVDNCEAGASHWMQYLLIGLISASSIYLIVMILLYKDRPKQARLTYFSLGLLAVQLLVAVLYIRMLPPILHSNGDGVVQFGFFFPAVSLLLAFISVRFIKKDEELVKSADRFY